MTNRTPPVALTLSKVSFASSGEKNLLGEPKIVAQVLRMPSPNENNNIAYMEATSNIVINGTGFAGAKKVDLYFQPQLIVGVDYEIVSTFPLANDLFMIRRRHGYKWRTEPGPLKLIGMDTGGGPVKLNKDDGIVIANVVEDLAGHSVTKEDAAEAQ